MLKILLFLIIILFISCTDKNVSTIQDSNKCIYSVDDGAFYLRKVNINGDRIYFVVNKEGQPIAGASMNYSDSKKSQHTSSVFPQ